MNRRFTICAEHRGRRYRPRAESGVGDADRLPNDCQSVLDVGAGNGMLSLAVAQKGKSVTAVDFSEVALAKASVPTLCRSADNLAGVEDRSYDLVLSTEMLEHLDEATYRGALRDSIVSPARQF